MNNKDLLKQYANTGAIFTEHQISKLNNNQLSTYFKRRISQWEHTSYLYELKDYECKFLRKEDIKFIFDNEKLWFDRDMLSKLTHDNRVYLEYLKGIKHRFIDPEWGKYYTQEQKDTILKLRIEKGEEIYTLTLDYFSDELYVEYLKTRIDKDGQYTFKFEFPGLVIREHLEDEIYGYFIENVDLSRWNIEDSLPIKYHKAAFKKVFLEEEMFYVSGHSDLLNSEAAMEAFWEVKIESDNVYMGDLDDMPDKYKKLYIDSAIENGRLLNPTIVDEFSLDQKGKYYSALVMHGEHKYVATSDRQYLDGPALKKYYDEKLKSGENLWGDDVKYLSKPQRNRWMLNRVVNEGYMLTDDEYKLYPLKIRRAHIDNTLKEFNYLEDFEIRDASDEQLKNYVTKKVKGDGYISAYDISLMPKEIQTYYYKLKNQDD